MNPVYYWTFIGNWPTDDISSGLIPIGLAVLVVLIAIVIIVFSNR